MKIKKCLFCEKEFQAFPHQKYCGRKVPEVILEIDHRFPKSKDGKDNINNYITSCRECNLGKGDIILKEFNN